MPRNQPVYIAIGADVYEMTGATPTEVTLVHRVSRTTRTLPHHELANLVEKEKHVSPRVLDTLPQHVLDRIITLAADMDQVLTGVSRSGKKDPDYDLATTSQETRITRKLAAMSDAGRGMGRSAFFDKLTRYRREGIMGLVDGRSLRQFPPLENLDWRVLQVLESVIDDQAQRSTGTISRIIREAEEALREQYGAIKLPSRANWYRLVGILGTGKYSTDSAKTRRSLAERPNRTYAKAERLMPGSEVQVDTNTMDVEVRTPKGERTRPRLTVMVDVYSRTIMAYTIRIGAAKAVDHTMLLAQALTPRPNRPSRTAWRNELQKRNPQHRLLSEEEYEEHAAAHPYIFPRSVSIDRGSDFAGLTFRAGLEQAGGSLVLSAPHTPTSKPHVERQFGTVNSTFTQYLDGYIGRSPEHRGREVPLDQLLTVEMLRELFEDWVISEWQNRPHSSLRDRLAPQQRGLTPNQKAGQAAMSVAQVRVALDRDDHIRMLVSTFRTITSTGVKYNNREYDSPLLHVLRGTKSGHPRQGGKWEVKVDPYNPECVWVIDGHDNLIECTERGADARLYEPEFIEAEAETYRAHTAQLDAELAGTPFPRATPPPLPEHTASTVDIDEWDDDEHLTDF